MKKYLSTSFALIFCSFSFGQTNVVFEERFNVGTYPDCGGYAPLPAGGSHGVTTYAYAPTRTRGDDNSSNHFGCGTNATCDINDGFYAGGGNIGEYAVVRNSGVSWWCNRQVVPEHTGTPNSGAMLINANNDLNQYFYTLKLTNLCPGTQYEFSAWYVSIAAPSEDPSEIIFQIYEGGNLNLSTGVHTGGTQITSGQTGLFGGTAGNGNPNATSFVWRQKMITFSTPSSSNPTTEYFLKLKNGRNTRDGNDLMIDDITVVKYTTTLYLFQAGTTKSSIEVCNNDSINASVALSAADISLITPNNTIYAQLMSSTDQTNWTAVGALKQQTGAGTISFRVAAPQTTGSTVYYRVKLSADQVRAADINLSLANEYCYNDVITQILNIERIGAAINVNITEDLTVCGNDENSFELPVLPTGNPADMYPTSYEIVFEQKAVAAGFPPTVSGTFNGGNSVNIPIPNNIYPDNYQFTINLNNALSQCGGTSYTRTLKVLYPSRIMEQKWNDVIAILKEEYCGYEHKFIGYEWYKSGGIMQGEEKSYIYIAPQKLNPADCYQVLIKRTDGSKVLSCCAKLEVKDENACGNCPQFPQISQGDGVIGISAIKEKTTLRLWTVTGVLLQNQTVNTSEHEIYVPTKGMYLLEITTQDNSFRKVVPIIVSR